MFGGRGVSGLLVFYFRRSFRGIKSKYRAGVLSVGVLFAVRVVVIVFLRVWRVRFLGVVLIRFFLLNFFENRRKVLDLF